MAIVVRLVLGFAADMHKDNHNDIGHEVAQRVDGIGHHGSTMSQDACHKLEQQQNHVDHAANHRYLVYLFVSFHNERKDTHFFL